MTLGWTIHDVLHAPLEDVQATTVNCGTCPVSLQCLVGQGGNGYVYDCCKATAVDVVENGGTHVLLLMDCKNHQFARQNVTKDKGRCPFCSGSIVLSDVLRINKNYRYVPTEHAAVSLKTRLALWKAKLPDAIKEVDELNKKGRR